MTPQHAANGQRVRVALDVTPAGAAIGGVARYTNELWRHLDEQPSIDVRAMQVGWRLPRVPGIRHVRAPMRLVHACWQTVHQPTAERIVGDVDVVHSIDLVAPPTQGPLVVTLHDVIALSRPDLFSSSSRRSFDRVVRQAHRATAIVTTCETTADDIASVAGFDRSTMIVAPPGLSPLPAPHSTRPIAEPYVLAVGAVTPRKGYEVLAEAAAALGPRCPQILIAGPDYWRADQVRSSVERHDRSHRVRFLGDVDDATLATLYRHAALVCHPSWAEGFGFPCLEAMTMGVPIVASDLPSIREMTAAAAELVAVGDPEALARGIADLLDDEGRRQHLVAMGRDRAATYSWSRTASIIATEYHRVTGVPWTR